MRKEPSQAQSRLIRAMAKTPFGGGIASSFSNGHDVGLVDAAIFIEELSERLREHVKNHESIAFELSQLKSDLAGLGRLINHAGITCQPAGVPPLSGG